MRISPHLTYSGECRAAFEFYRELLGGSLQLLTYGESPAADHVSADWHSKIVHATLSVVNGMELAGADVQPDEYEKAQGFYVLLQVDDLPEAQRMFDALSQDGEVRMPLQETFWSVGYGILVDRFGTPWEISCAQDP